MLQPACFSASVSAAAKLHMRVACSANIAAFLLSLSWVVRAGEYQMLENARKNAEHVENMGRRQ